jgi:hypothetical protein
MVDVSLVTMAQSMSILPRDAVSSTAERLVVLPASDSNIDKSSR